MRSGISPTEQTSFLNAFTLKSNCDLLQNLDWRKKTKWSALIERQKYKLSNRTLCLSEGCWSLIKRRSWRSLVFRLIRNVFSGCYYGDAGSFYKRVFVWGCTCNLENKFVYSFRGSRPLNVLSVIQLERRRGSRDAVTRLNMDSQRHPVGHTRMTM